MTDPPASVAQSSDHGPPEEDKRTQAGSYPPATSELLSETLPGLDAEQFTTPAKSIGRKQHMFTDLTERLAARKKTLDSYKHNATMQERLHAARSVPVPLSLHI